MFTISKFIESRSVAAEGGGGGMGSDSVMGPGFLLGDENVLELDGGNGCTTM